MEGLIDRRIGGGIMFALGILVVCYAFPIADAMWRYNSRIRRFREPRCFYRIPMVVIGLVLVFFGWAVVWASPK